MGEIFPVHLLILELIAKIIFKKYCKSIRDEELSRKLIKGLQKNEQWVTGLYMELSKGAIHQWVYY